MHATATWSTREDRKASLVWLGLIWVGMFLGFGFDLKRYFHESPAAPTIVHIHAVVFTIWLLLLTSLVLLVENEKVQVHRKLGWFAGGWACLMTVLGPWAILASMAVNLNHPDLIPPPFLSIAFSNSLLFAALTGVGVLLRRNSAAHKRIMILATAAMADPGFSRFTGYLWPAEPHSPIVWYFYTYYGDLLLILLIFLWDWKKGRVMKQYVYAASAVLLIEFMAVGLYFWEPWKVFTRNLIETWARLS